MEQTNGTEAARQAWPHTHSTVALIPAGDRFEDFFDKIRVSLETFRTELTGGWLFNYIKALRLAGVRTVLIYASARVNGAIRFTHVDTEAAVWVLPSPVLHQKARNMQRRFFPDSAALAATSSYLSIPLRTLARVLRRERCDAILSQEYEHARFDACVLLGRLLKLPVFGAYQGGSATGSWIERPIRRVSIDRCAGLVIPSGTEIARVQSTYGVDGTRIGCIPNPVEGLVGGTSDRLSTRSRLGIAISTRVVAWHGRVQVRTKGLDILLDAWDRVCAERPGADILLLLVGSGRDVDVLRDRIRASSQVIWIDQYVFDRPQLWSYLSAADIYTIPSRREGFAVAVLEAMACGLPAVASDAPGVADVVPGGEADGAIIVPRESADALAAALLRLIDDPDLARRLGAAARRRVREEFSLEVVGRMLRQFLLPESLRAPT